MTQTEHGEILTQRLTLVSDRIREIAQDPETNSVYARYFKETALFLCEAQKVFDGTYDLSSMHADELEDLSRAEG